MDWLGCVLCFFAGAFLVLLVQWLLFVWYVQSAPTGDLDSEPPLSFHLPKNLENMGLYSDNGDCAAAVSLTMQFLFQELKHAPVPLAWLHRKLHQEIVDLLTRTTSGKLFDTLTIRNVLTGDAAPRIRWAGVENVETGSGGYIKTVDLIVDIHYSGGFKLTVDAGMLLGKTACFHIEVAHLSGRARVRFTREPYTHWSLSFLSPPHLDLYVHPLQKRIAALLQAHARRALQKRHTLPNYTIRYKPFFTKIDPAQLDPPIDDPTIKFQGNFEINILEVSRLFTKSWMTNKVDSPQIYFTLSLDSNPWISFRQNEEYNIFTIDIVVNKEHTQQLGTVFKQVQPNDKSKPYVVIETVVPLSAAYKADLRRDDIIIAVDSKIVNGMNQIVKIIKSINRPCFTIRIERRTRKSVVENDKLFRRDDQKQDMLTAENSADDSVSLKRTKSNSFSFRKMSEVIESAKSVGQEGKALLRGSSINISSQDSDKLNSETSFCETNKNYTDEMAKAANIAAMNTVSFSKHSDSLAFGFGLRKRRCSVENKTSSDSSNGSTPSVSSPGTPSKRTDKSSREQTKSNNDETPKDNQLPCLDSSASIELLKIDDKNYDVKKNYSDSSLSTPRICVMNVNNENTKIRSDQNEIVDLLQTHTSKFSPLSDIVQFNEKLSFKLNRNHRYLNLNIWGKNAMNDDTLLAYLNIPLQTVLKECNSSKMSQYIKKFILLPPEVNLSVSKLHPLSTHSGFEPCLCYGDVLITFVWPNQMNIIDSKNQENKYTPLDSENDCMSEFELLETHIMEDDSIKSKSTEDCTVWKSHDFIRTHFHRSTQCDYCRKKIWLKDAVQCRDCAMCCHKKCVSKCLSSVRCPLPPVGQIDDNSSPQREFFDDNVSQMPEFSMTEYLDTSDDYTHSQDSSQKHTNQKHDEGLLGRNTFSGLLGGLRRVGSAHSLCPQGPTTPIARSLPPSPHHTSRSQSPDEDTAWHALEVAAGEGVKSAMDLLKPLLAAHLSSDLLLSKARDFGPRLLAHLPPEERIERISNLISEVRSALDNENARLIELQHALINKNLTSQERTKCVRNLEDCEEKSQALTALLLHCCSAMQSANKNSV